MTNPNPSSPEAIQAGCTCPVMDNSHGQGYRDDPTRFVINGNCPLHGQEAKTNMQSEPKVFRANDEDR